MENMASVITMDTFNMVSKKNIEIPLILLKKKGVFASSFFLDLYQTMHRLFNGIDSKTLCIHTRTQADSTKKKREKKNKSKKEEPKMLANQNIIRTRNRISVQSLIHFGFITLWYKKSIWKISGICIQLMQNYTTICVPFQYWLLHFFFFFFPIYFYHFIFTLSATHLLVLFGASEID